MLAILPLVSLGGCLTALGPSSFSDGVPAMLPEVFFTGVTRSSGVLETRSGAPARRLHVEGVGQAQPDGSFRLVQTVTLDHDPSKKRTWVMRRLDDHRYTATLTDASGPVEGEAYGDLFHLRYAMRTPVGGEMEQWLYLQPDGRTVMNEATVRVFGIVAAHLSERITRQGDQAESPRQ